MEGKALGPREMPHLNHKEHMQKYQLGTPALMKNTQLRVKRRSQQIFSGSSFNASFCSRHRG